MNRWQIDDVFTMTEKLSFNYVRCNIAIVPYKSAIFSSVRDKRNLKLFYDLRKRVSGWIFFCHSLYFCNYILAGYEREGCVINLE